MPPKRAAARGGVVEPLGPLGGDVEPKPKYTLTQGAKIDPSPTPPIDELVEADKPELLTVSPIDWTLIPLERGQQIRDAEWSRSPAKKGIWTDMDILRGSIELRGMPETPIQMPEGTQPMLIITLAPPCSGKGTVLETVYKRLGIPDKNSILNADPDDMFYETITELLGWMPPKAEDDWLGFAEAKQVLESDGVKHVKYASHEQIERAKLAAKQSFYRYENVMPLSELTRVNQRPTAPAWSCTSKAKKIPIGPKYEEMLRITKDYIFQLATANRLNIVLNVTGMSMLGLIDEYIAKADQVKYPVVIVGIHSTVDNCKARAKFRNSNQHRDMSETIVENTNYDFQTKGTIFNWEQKSRENGYRFILLENRWIPSSSSDGEHVTLLCDRDRDERFLSPPAGSLLTTGVYGMRWLQEPTPHFNIEEKDSVIKAAKAAAEAAKKAAAAAKEAKAGAAAGAGAAVGLGGYSRKRRLHTNRPRKTMKKYVRRVTRRRSRGGHRSRRYRR
jgi:hypothetical protein